MTLDQLQALVAIAETGTVAAAAERLFRTQPTVSVAMRHLQDELGVRIWQKQGQRNVMTPEGERLLKQARLVLAEADRLTSIAKHMRNGYESRVHVVFAGMSRIDPIVEILQQVQAQFPQTQITLDAEYMGGAQERILEGDADIAVYPYFDIQSELESMLFDTICMLPVCAPDFIDTTREISRAKLRGRVQVVLRDSSQHSRDDVIRGAIEGSHLWFVNEQDTKKQMLLAGRGFGGMPEPLIREELADGRLVPMHIERAETHRTVEVRVVRVGANAHGPVAQALWEAFAAAAQV